MKQLFFALLIITTSEFYAQSFAPAPGNPGSTAIHKDSSIFTAWANGIEFHRGYQNISDKSLGLTSFGDSTAALYLAEGNSFDVVSFGDSGVAILTFEYPISNGSGYDFAVFENGFSDDYVEYAFVEVSSDGSHFVRFPAISETPIVTQLSSFEYSDCRYVNNLAGKYRQGFGTPFDLQELADSANLDLNRITHVKIIDVIGSIDTLYGTFDSQGTIINDPWPSPFDSGGFDLDGVGVIHQNLSEVIEEKFDGLISETTEEIMISSDADFSFVLLSVEGKILEESNEKSSSHSFKKRANPSLSFLKLIFDDKTSLIQIFY